MKRKFLFVAATLLLIFGLLQIALWNANGGLIDFISGQMKPNPVASGLASGPASAEYEVQVTADLSTPVNTVSAEYISFSIDLSQVVGGKWWNPRAEQKETGSGTLHAPIFDFNRKKLDTLARALSPAYLRIGGSESDKAYYDLINEKPAIPAGYHSVMTARQWDAVNEFAKRNALKIVFTLNTGPASRKEDGSWNPSNAQALIEYTAKRNYRVDLWELGNELNIFWFVHGLRSHVPVEQYDRDLARARGLVKMHSPGARFAAQGSAFWPLLGEPLGFFYAYMPAFVQRSSDKLDIISWHYYPQQSRRGPIASRRAHPARLLDPENLNEAGYWADRMVEWRDKYAPGRPIWLGETGNAQFGGEPGLSDVYLGGLWWLDQLGLLAQKGHDVVVRQTLSGMNYGMIEDDTLIPRPDYWNSLYWKKLMGQRVYAAKSEGSNKARLRVYAHSSLRAGCEKPVFLIINLDPAMDARVSFPAQKDDAYSAYVFTTPDLYSNKVLLNDSELLFDGSAALPMSGSKHQTGGIPEIRLNPLSYAFVDFCT